MGGNRRKPLVAAIFAAVILSTIIGANVAAVESSDSREVRRLGAHFKTVIRELRSAEITHLLAPQRAARAELISRLERYAAAGRFPHNHVAAGKRVPVFRDEHGTLCAMGYLIATTGRMDIVDDVVRGNNLARIPELAGDMRLRAWLDSTGLTAAEAARIQPSYDGDRCIGCLIPSPEPTTVKRASTEYHVGSAVASALSGAASVVNLLPRTQNTKVVRRNAAVGFMAGAGQVVLGAFVLDQHGAALGVGVANIAIGAASIASSVWRMHRLPEPTVAARSVSLSPVISGRSVGLVFSAGL